MDFTLRKYTELLKTIGSGDYTIKNNINRGTIIRHDVDRDLSGAIKMAMLESKLDVKSTYYFRVPKTFDAEIIDRISNFGHEVGYHYEVLDKAKGDYNEAIKLFKRELALFEKWNIKTICMHGNPLTKWNNRDLWREYDFRRFGLIGEAYITVDFKKTNYFTDTGRKWNSRKFSVKDKADTRLLCISNTDHLIFLLKNKEIKKFYIVIHPHRWNDTVFFWAKELIWQNIKNLGKSYLNRSFHLI